MQISFGKYVQIYSHLKFRVLFMTHWDIYICQFPTCSAFFIASTGAVKTIPPDHDSLGFLLFTVKGRWWHSSLMGLLSACVSVCVCWVSGDPCKGSELECSHCWRPARTLPELAQTHTDKALHVELMYRTCQPGYTISALHNDVWAFQARCRLFIPQNGDSPRREGK